MTGTGSQFKKGCDFMSGEKVVLISVTMFALALFVVPRAYSTISPVGDVEILGVEVVQDFEGESKLKNNLGGNSGTWNLDPTDEYNSFTDIEVVEMPGIDGKLTHVGRLNYSVDSSVPSQNGYWTELKDFDATGYDHFAFDVKGDIEKGFTEQFKIEIKRFKDDSLTEKIKGTYVVRVTEDWKTVMIPLNRMTGLVDFGDPKAWEKPEIARKHLNEFVIIFQDRHVTQKTGMIYIDNIRLLKTSNPGPTAIDFPPRSREKTKTKIEGLEFAKLLVARLGGFPDKVVVKKNFSDIPEEFLMEIARDTWRFFDEIVDRENGLPLDTIQIGSSLALDEDTWIGDYTNITNIGIYLMCIVSAYDLKIISKEDALERISKTLSALEKMEYHESGFPYNYYDTTLLEHTSYFVSLVDSGWLVAGLYVAKNAFPEELTERTQRLIDRGNFMFFYDPSERQMYHGYYAHLQVYSDYHYGIFYTEPRVASYMAIARGDVPEEHWFLGLVRTIPEKFDWQNQTPKNRVKKTTRGFIYEGGYYEWKDIQYVPSWGGSAFEALMPPLLLNEDELGPEGLGLNNLRHAQGQIRYALDDLEYPVWGMSPCSVPEGGYSEYGVTPFGSKGYKTGVVTPHASILALEYAPDEVVRNLRQLIELFDIYGEYGFYDAVNVKTGLVARKYLALDQGMILVAINNYLNHGAIRNRFHQDEEMKKGEVLISSEKLFSDK